MKGIRIQVIQGTTASRETDFFFDHSHDYIVIGRDRDACHIVFDQSSHQLGIGSEHLAFQRSLGRYQLDLHNDHYVELDNVMAFEGQEVSGTSTLTLGEGVRIKVEVVDQRVQPKKVGKRHIHPGRRSLKNHKLLWAGFAGLITTVFALVLLGTNLFNVEQSLENSEANVAQAVDDISREIGRLESQSDNISQATIDRVSRSVYLVLVTNRDGGERPQGTAWVTDDNYLATNAHVADAFFTLRKGEQLVVRASHPPYNTFTVSEAIIHPGFKSYLALWQSYVPTQKTNQGLSIMSTITPADVALLKLKNAEGLDPPIDLATPSDLEQLRPGMRVGYVGFPMERLLPGSFKAPAPVAQQDEIIRITDFFMVKRVDGDNRLIQHGLPLTGGASGSPIINSEGRVIALVSAMNAEMVADGGRFANPADVNFGQRVDFLYHLLQGNQRLATRDLIQQWKKSLKQFVPARIGSEQSVVEGVKKIFSLESLETQKTIKGKVTVSGLEPERRFSVDKKTLQLKKKGLYLLTLISDKPLQKITLNDLSNKNISSYTTSLPFDDFAAHRIIIASEPSEITVNSSIAHGPSEKGVYSYELSLYHYPQDDLNSAELLVQSFLEKNSPVDGEVKLIKQSLNLGFVKKKDKHHITGFEVDLEKPGLYGFVAVPIGAASKVDTLLMDNNTVLEQDKSDNAIGIMFYEHKKATNKTLSFIAFGKRAKQKQHLLVYYISSQ